MPPRVRLSEEEAQRLPSLLAMVASRRDSFPAEADAPAQAKWISERYVGVGEPPLPLNLVTLLLFEHGVHRSVDQVARDLVILREETETESRD